MQLGFLHFETRDPGAWDAFLTDVLGLSAVGGGRYRMDDHAWRFQITEGPTDDLHTVGWEMTPDELSAALSRLDEAGVPATPTDPAERGVAQRVYLRDPAGVPVELVTGMARVDSPFQSERVRSGFVADDLGLGHLVITAPDPAASRRFYEGLLGFRLSDHIRCEYYGYPVDLAFFHVGPRHHSLAFGGPQRKRLHHFMLEARRMDDVGLAWDRTIRHGLRIMQTLGRHPNDRMFSFYAQTPGGFQVEVGWGGREIDDEDWEPMTYDRISEWGHHPPGAVFGRER